MIFMGRQRGRVVSALDSQFRGPGFEFRADHYLDMFYCSSNLNCSVTLVNSQLVILFASFTSNRNVFYSEAKRSREQNRTDQVSVWFNDNHNKNETLTKFHFFCRSSGLTGTTGYVRRKLDRL